MVPHHTLPHHGGVVCCHTLPHQHSGMVCYHTHHHTSYYKLPYLSYPAVRLNTYILFSSVPVTIITCWQYIIVCFLVSTVDRLLESRPKWIYVKMSRRYKYSWKIQPFNPGTSPPPVPRLEMLNFGHLAFLWQNLGLNLARTPLTDVTIFRMGLNLHTKVLWLEYVYRDTKIPPKGRI